ncbi:hypothetical protein RJ639_024378, partial [Escallonia herrerae]
ATATKKPAGKQIKEKPRLPSNWDRYEEEYDSGTEIPVEGSSTVSQHSDVVVPKSKGADYRFLVSEAKSQMGSSSNVFPAFDDVFTDDDSEIQEIMAIVEYAVYVIMLGDCSFDLPRECVEWLDLYIDGTLPSPPATVTPAGSIAPRDNPAHDLWVPQEQTLFSLVISSLSEVISLALRNSTTHYFNQGLGALLSVRGKSTLSWTEGGNFVVENKATASN